MYIRDKIKLYSRFNVEGALKMLKKGDVISYGTTGVCKVEGECEQTVKGQKKRYIVLKPVHQINSTLYVPVDNDELKTKFKPLLTGDEDHKRNARRELPLERKQQRACRALLTGA